MNCILAAAFFLAASPVAPAKQAHSVDLRLKCKVGTQNNYRIKSTVSAVGAEGALSWTTDVHDKLEKIAGAEYHWTTQYTIKDARATGVMTGGDAQINQLNGLVVTRVLNNRGELLRMIANGVESKRSGSSSVTYPGRVTKVGESWRSSIEVAGAPLPITYRLTAVKKANGKTLANITGNFPKDSIARAVKPTSFWVDVATGLTVSASATTEATTRGRTVRVEYTVQRI